MDKNKQRIAIAEARGYTQRKCITGCASFGWHADDGCCVGATENLPDYLNDLNEIHKAFASQPHLTQLEVIDRLVANKPTASPLEAVAYSTAEDWAKALLEALNLWKP